jgi:hypothetical protein
VTVDQRIRNLRDHGNRVYHEDSYFHNNSGLIVNDKEEELREEEREEEEKDMDQGALREVVEEFKETSTAESYPSRGEARIIDLSGRFIQGDDHELHGLAMIKDTTIVVCVPCKEVIYVS